jgi:endonuclease/exonuclease/phosphatase family metal-dependent hydrolase
MKVATYNLLKGGSQRVHWVRMVEDLGVDLLLVQESYPHHEHLPPLTYPDAGKRSAWEMAQKNGWGSGVFSRDGSVKPVAVPDFPGWVVGAEITGASWQAGVADPLLAFSVHAPSRGEAYWKQVNKLLDEIKKVAAGRDVVIGGDFNLTVGNWPGPVRPTGKRDLAIQARLADEFGLLNCWPAANPHRPLCQTLRWTGNRATPYHCDGIFVPRSWQDRLRSCVVLAGGEWDRLSDHNPVVACFKGKRVRGKMATKGGAATTARPGEIRSPV